MKRGTALALVGGIAVFTTLAIYLDREPQSPFQAEMRIVGRTRSASFEETTIHKVPFAEFVTRLRDLYPNWKVGFRDQTITFRSPDGTRSLWASPGYYNPEPEWTDLDSSDGWSTLIMSRPVSWTDWLRTQKMTKGTMVVDIPLSYWGQPDKFGFSLKLDKLPSWLSEIYTSRTGIQPKPQSKVGVRP